jgi:hypothetical protein
VISRAAVGWQTVQMYALAVTLLTGCSQVTEVEVEQEVLPNTETNFARLPSILAGIRGSEGTLLYEGLPSSFWEPELRNRELQDKRTFKLHGYVFYEEPLAWLRKDAEEALAVFKNKSSFAAYRRSKQCWGYNPEFGIRWTTGTTATNALICLECGEVKMFGPRDELYCDLNPNAQEILRRVLTVYRKHGLKVGR